MPVTDSWAIEGASAVADALAGREEFDHVEWMFPDEDELAIAVNIGTKRKPFVLGFTHGHVMKTSARALEWWRDQSHGRQPVGAADLLLTAHFHHYRAEQTGGNRTWIQIPALDGGSSYFRHQTGADEPAGMVSLWLRPGVGNGWHGLTIHS